MSICLLLMTSLCALLFDQTMTDSERQETGIENLTPLQRAALERWIERRCATHAPSSSSSGALYLSQNINNGQQLRLTDGSLYEVSPADLDNTAFWITPFPISIGESSDPDYPILITNQTSGTSVRARLLEPPMRTNAGGT